ncbi:DDE-type integrase/transposase/recombinase [Mycoplasmopsis cynos]|uniref:DDE-type integrase/transposase/recombinase n=1 Tax=Mycoplasmopsis cynos TaxID=171284 RepID=UPI002AFE7B02|nr:DDE-type integrase/transposase/recombinase [Mycoplasmopsis cynos]WQQ16138.1 DDE-type integrase/transposase/recombinase [Mycoplasmopsis cynos]
MSRTQFTVEQKLKYINIANSQNLDMAVITFVEDFWETRYKETYENKSSKKWYVNPFYYATAYIKKWINIYNFDMKNLKSKTGKSPKKGKGVGRKRKYTIIDLDNHDKKLYQEIMEEILEDHGINPEIIIKRIKERKDKGSSFHNLSRASVVFDVNRTSVYKNYKPVIKQKDKHSYIDNELIDWIKEEITKSNNTIGRDKLYRKYINLYGNIFSYYVFRLNFESLNYKSSAYTKKNKNKPPKEEKYSKIWTNDYVNGVFNSNYFGEVLHADIKYVKVNNVWHYLHVITETFSNSILTWSLSTDRSSDSTIKLLDKCLTDYKIKPKYFHTDHGVEYANYNFLNFLNKNGIQQSMSPKGNSLRNRPSEFLFSIFQREFFNITNIENLQLDEVRKRIDNFVKYYNFERPQKNLKYHTPYSYWKNFKNYV